jgi:hypothetical protein
MMAVSRERWIESGSVDAWSPKTELYRKANHTDLLVCSFKCQRTESEIMEIQLARLAVLIEEFGRMGHA